MQLNAISNFATKALNYCKSTYQKISSKVASFLNPARKANQVALHQAQKDIGEKCGLVGIYLHNGAKLGEDLYSAMTRLQHRGQCGCGYASSSGQHVTGSRKAGKLVNEFFNKGLIRAIDGNLGIGHTLYATSKEGDKVHPQPILEPDANSPKIAVAHNGNIPDLTKLKKFLTKQNVEVEGLSDSTLISKTIYHFYKKGNPLPEAMELASKHFGEGAYCLLAMDKNQMVVLRDPIGIRPLSIGARKDGSIVVASETTVFNALGAKHIRDVKPGELVVVNNETTAEGIKKKTPKIIFDNALPEAMLCAGEWKYIARPDSILGETKSASEHRRELGKITAKEFRNRFPKKNIDYVIPVLDGGLAAATGFAEELKVPINPALIKNFHRRTFIDGGNKANLKFTVVEDAIKGKDIAIVDDSIYRGITSEPLMKLLRAAGPNSIHLVSASPPVLYPNFYGLDVATQKELIAAKHKNNWDKIAKKIDANSVTYLSTNGFLKGLGFSPDQKRVELSQYDGNYVADLGSKKDRIVKQKFNDFGKSFATLA